LSIAAECERPSPDLAVQRKTTPWARFRAAQRVFYDARRAKAEAAMTARRAWLEQVLRSAKA